MLEVFPFAFEIEIYKAKIQNLDCIVRIFCISSVEIPVGQDCDKGYSKCIPGDEAILIETADLRQRDVGVLECFH